MKNSKNIKTINSTLEKNKVYEGAGIYTQNIQNLIIKESIIKTNHANKQGGGIMFK